MMTMTSNKPYLIRAMYDWIVDNDLTPYLLINVACPDVQVPQEHVTNGRIVLNISPVACRGLHLENDRIVFTARFSGQSVQVFATPVSVMAIYAKENGRGMEFNDDVDDESTTAPSSGVKAAGRGKPALTLVKKEPKEDK